MIVVAAQLCKEGIERRLRCPSCSGAHSLAYHSSYKRYVRFSSGKASQITIRRVYCRACKHTHALIPSFIIPYKTMSLSFCAQILLMRICGCTVQEICKTYQIDPKTFYQLLSQQGGLEAIAQKNGMSLEELLWMLGVDASSAKEAPFDLFYRAILCTVTQKSTIYLDICTGSGFT